MAMFIIGIIYLVIGVIYSLMVQITFILIERDNEIEETVVAMLELNNFDEESRMVYGHDKNWTWQLMKVTSAIGCVILWPMGIINTIRIFREIY